MYIETLSQTHIYVYIHMHIYTIHTHTFLLYMLYERHGHMHPVFSKITPQHLVRDADNHYLDC